MNTFRLLPRAHWAPPIALGAITAGVATVGVRYLGFWAVPAVCALAAGLASTLATDGQRYWIAAYALVLPLEVKKMLVDSTPVREFVAEYGFPAGEVPGPVLYLSDIVLVMLLAHWWLEARTMRRSVFFPKSNIVVLAFIGWAALSIVNAVSLSSGAYELVRIVKLYVLFLYAANNIVSRARLKVLVGALLVGAVLQGVLCIGQFVRKDQGFLASGVFSRTAHLSSDTTQQIGTFFAISDGGGVRASGTAGASDAEAQYFEFLIPVAFGLCLAAVPVLRKTAPAALIFAVAGLVLTFSRAGLAGCAAGFLAALLCAYAGRLIGLKTVLGWSLAGLVVIVLASPLAYRYLTTRPEAITARFQLNQVGMEMIKSHPILGVGLNNHLVVKAQYDRERYVFPLPTHNHYILTGSQVGIPGLVLFVGVLTGFLRAAARGCRQRDVFGAVVSVGLMAGIVAVSVHVLADYIGTYTNVSLLWLYGGAAEALGRPDGWVTRDI